MSPKLLPSAIYGEEFGLRPNTKVTRQVINFIFNEGGLGDFVNYSAATIWLAKNCPWIEGRLFVPTYIVPLMKDIHEEFRDWEVYPSERATEYLEEGTAMKGPSLMRGKVNTNPQLLTSLGCHPIDLAFGYYTSTCPAPADAMLPVLDYPATRLLPQIKRLHGKYAVLPTGAVAQARQVEGMHLNPLIDYLVAKGITPVFLGKRSIHSTAEVTARFSDDIDYHKGIDLREQTSIKDAACIMQHAAMTLGLDCGLLHLASLMKGSRIIFGYNVTTVEHREPRRKHGKLINLYVPKEALSCTACQSNVKLLPAHLFDKCLYRDNLCIDLLFGDPFWKDAIDRMLAT